MDRYDNLPQNGYFLDSPTGKKWQYIGEKWVQIIEEMSNRSLSLD